MFIKIKDTSTRSTPDWAVTDETRYAIIAIDAVEAITFVKECKDKIKIHLKSGKEFKADIQYLGVISNFLLANHPDLKEHIYG